MLTITDLKTGVVINLEGAPYEVVRYQHSKMGRGGAVLRTTLKNLITGNNIERTFHGDEKFAPAELERKKAQFLYRQGGDFVVMDTASFDQLVIPATTVGFAANFIKDGQEVDLLTFDSNPISLSLPFKMPFKVTESEPAVKGDSATNPMKNARLETGFTVRVPMFVSTGDTIIVDTRDGSYIERAK
ncbi:MAG: elongation factor P, elongation factor P [candidate division Kazan bacterium GW2011_GWA1_50_15]|uniref:Elongation factor P n=2 Tax=Bacteria division Kazan-3B-28 TaxID=1798534 RepID=A0A0G1X7V1_UNCK3|nr:MAG: elongation factor P, elongation factor P [candidate division Kazan bacterium GW2011_GWA1_50_15]KKW25722.1 MAG: Elongation factor P [candidate division Kazan bacterium GW2011_GWC1_52_13]KKW27263.1 MAG: Elongation factor P [candidate division Kazan bacterium GW2011_GWB1_52_7]HAV65989.1 elongation factor P [Patescibacteria group bacterium]HCR42557.1 elongation factor P [Patescibacteria group bacterium]